MDFTHTYQSPLGEIILSSDGKSLTGLCFENSRGYKAAFGEEVADAENISVFDETIRWLDEYFSGKQPAFTPHLCLCGSEFQKRVCQIMLEIPYGKTCTYGWIAQRIASERNIAKMSAQAVGGAVGRNPISIIIPCHRVVGTNGSLTGYGGGMWRKVKLLELEKADMSKLFVPKQGTTL